MKHYDPVTYSPFISCVEADGNYGHPSAFEGCANLFGLDYDLIASCANNTAEAFEVSYENAKKTIDLGLAKYGTPWVTVNGVALDDTDQLLRTVCEAYEGTKPAGCQNLPPPKVRSAIHRSTIEV